MAGKYADLTRDELVKLLEARDRRKKLGLVWEREEIAADRRRNADFVVCETLLRKSADGRTSPIPGETYPTALVTGMPSAV